MSLSKPPTAIKLNSGIPHLDPVKTPIEVPEASKAQVQAISVSRRSKCEAGKTGENAPILAGLLHAENEAISASRRS